MDLFTSLAVLAPQADDGLSLGDFVASLPTDPASLFAIGLMIAALAVVLWFGSRGGRAP